MCIHASSEAIALQKCCSCRHLEEDLEEGLVQETVVISSPKRSKGWHCVSSCCKLGLSGLYLIHGDSASVVTGHRA